LKAANETALTGRSAGRYIIPKYSDDIRIDIGAFIQFDKRLVSRETYRDAAAAGFNVIGIPVNIYNYSVENLLESMDYCGEAGIKVLVHDPHIHGDKADPEKYLFHYRDHPAFYGNELRDEPNPPEFAALGVTYDAYKKAASGKLGLINMLPISSFGRAYVADFYDTIRPDLLSYDHYPILAVKRADDPEKTEIKLRADYFENLGLVAWTAKQNNIPAHSYIQAIAHSHAVHQVTYPQPTETSLRWLIACNMTFGFSSFTYFTYWTPGSADPGMAGDGWYYHDGIIARDGRKTELYDFAKTVNQEALAWDHVYLRFKWQGIAPINGNHDVKNHMLETITDGRVYPDGIDGIKKIVSSEDTLCGIFTDGDGNRAYMITNAVNPYDQKTALVNITFDDVYKGLQVFEKGISRIVDLNEDGGAEFTLAPGEGKFLIPLATK
jgi:hypothetical protein